MKAFAIMIMTMGLFMAASPADASGFIFKWESFVMNHDYSANDSEAKVFTRDINILRVKETMDDDYLNLSHVSVDQDKFSNKKSFWELIKINISTSDRLTANTPEKPPDTDDEQISRFMNAVTSLIYDDSKVKSLENIGTIIEPQINFYFEF